jgi:hypothetical protein
MGSCAVCIYTLGRIREGMDLQLPAICSEIWSSSNDKTLDYDWCQMVLGSLSSLGRSVRDWIHYGCYKSESYGAMELIRPCPDQAICSELRDLRNNTFCWTPGSDFDDENLKKERKWFAEGGEVSSAVIKEEGITKKSTWSGHHGPPREKDVVGNTIR